MAITKIHPIKSTLNLAIDYITKSEKTDEKILVSSFKCHPSTAHIQFLKTRKIIFYSIYGIVKLCTLLHYKIHRGYNLTP